MSIRENVATVARRWKNAEFLHALAGVATTFVLTLAVYVGLAVVVELNAEITSENHPTLQRALEKHPDGDTDNSGVLSFEEYEALLVKHPPKQENGQPAGPISTALPNGNLVIAELEENNPGTRKQWGWTLSGVFDRDLNGGTQLMKRRAGLPRGKYLATSYIESDADVGEMISPAFVIEQSHVEALFSGGQFPGRTCINLLVDEEVVRTATGQNDDYLEPFAFDVKSLQGKTARVQIVDSHREIWGHINVDRIYQTNKPNAERIISEVPAQAGGITGTILTHEGERVSGNLSMDAGVFSVNGKPVPLDSLLIATTSSSPAPMEGMGAVTLVNGENWRAKIVGFDKGQLALESPLVGRREIAVEEIAHFDLSASASDDAKPGMLYRNNGPPIAGKLVWVRDKDIAIDCALGIVPLPRNIVDRFVFTEVEAAVPRGPAEIRLVDGNLFRGSLGASKDKLIVTHETLGELAFGIEQIQSIQQSPANVTWLDRLAATDLEQIGPVLPPPAPRVTAGRNDHLASLRVLPRTVATYSLDGEGTKTLRGAVSPVAGARSTALIKIAANERIVWEHRLEPGMDPAEFEVALGEAKALTIEVDFGDGFVFPCGAELLDAYIVTNSN